MKPILEIQLHSQVDASASRQRASQIAGVCGFSRQDQTRLAAAVSELARTATNHVHPGLVTFFVTSQGKSEHLVVEVLDRAWDADRDGRRDPDAQAAFDAGMSAALRFTPDTVIDERRGSRGIRLSKARPAGAPAVDPLGIVDAVAGLGTLSANVALSEAQQRNRALQARTNSVASLNSELQVQAESLISADRRKDEFLAVLAHELRGPLSALTMASGVLALGTCDAGKAVHLGQLIARQTAHMSRIVEDLLDVSRIVRNEVRIERRRLALQDVVLAAVEQLEPAAQRRRQALEVRMPPAPVGVEGDRTRLVQVFSNLIGNAIRYTPEGGRIEVELLADDAPGHARLSVTDNGIGISAELLPKLFDLFSQAERSTDSRNSGLGLGLALVKTLAEAHGGAVTATSPGAGLGSRFEVRLPRI